MHFAAVSDIHGNLPALEAVMADIAARGITQIVNLGDSLSGPLWPRETAQRLMALNWPTLAGNHERQLLTIDPAEMGPTDAAAHAAIDDDIRAWMAALPGTMEWPDPNSSGNVLLCHATPDSDDTYWLHRRRKGSRGRMRESTHEEILPHASHHALTLCGHTHMPRVVALPDGRQIANAGSVGLPAYEDDVPSWHVVETGTPDARYLSAEFVDGRWHVTLHAVAYDHESAARRAEAMGRAGWAQALRTGKMG
ncbi:MAG: metallophosphoesterase [Novosphingobium sp.]|nr:metallophosphoesterase [Novosphingobium sp.]